MRLRDCHNFHDFRQLARRRLPSPIFDYIDGAADDEVTYRQNTASYERCDLVPNVLRGVETVDISVTVMGQKLAMPFYCSPTAPATSVPSSGRTCRRSCGGEVRHDVRRILAWHGQYGGIT
jgi:isopentenyl diphosphate isomerase/L-lactate dehydrogenase-like FMN-dependent dehydrogenase